MKGMDCDLKEEAIVIYDSYEGYVWVTIYQNKAGDTQN